MTYADDQGLYAYFPLFYLNNKRIKKQYKALYLPLWLSWNCCMLISIGSSQEYNFFFIIPQMIIVSLEFHVQRECWFFSLST